MQPALGGVSRRPVTNSAYSGLYEYVYSPKKHSKSQGFCVSDTANIDDLLESADDPLVRQIIAKSLRLSLPRQNICAL